MVDGCIVGGENLLRAEEPGREELVKVAEGTVDDQPTQKWTGNVSLQGDRGVSQVQIMLVETVVTSIVLKAVSVIILDEISLLTKVSIRPTPSNINVLSSV